MENNSELFLAKKRTILAGIRTSLSFVRTALVCLSVIFAFAKLDKKNPIDVFSVSLIIVGVVCLILALTTYITIKVIAQKVADDK